MTWTSVITPVIIAVLVGLLVNRIEVIHKRLIEKRGIERAIWIPSAIFALLLGFYGTALTVTKVIFKISPANTAVFIDGRRREREVYPILGGSHTMWLEKEGYKSIKGEEFWVFPLTTRTIEKDLEAKCGQIVIDLDPYRPSIPIYVSISDSEAEITKFSTKQRISYKVPFGTYYVAIRRAKDTVPIYRQIHVYAEKSHHIPAFPERENI